MNDHNLIPVTERSQEDAKRIASLGGQARARQAKRRKTLQETVESVLSLQIRGGEAPADVDSAESIKEVANANLTIAERMVVDLVNTALDSKSSKKEKLAAMRMLTQMLGQQQVDVTIRKDESNITLDEALEWAAAHAGELRRE